MTPLAPVRRPRSPDDPARTNQANIPRRLSTREEHELVSLFVPPHPGWVIFRCGLSRQGGLCLPRMMIDRHSGAWPRACCVPLKARIEICLSFSVPILMGYLPILHL